MKEKKYEYLEKVINEYSAVLTIRARGNDYYIGEVWDMENILFSIDIDNNYTLPDVLEVLGAQAERYLLEEMT